MAQLSQLPEELLLAIFRHVPTSNLANISMVCKKWRRLANDFSLYHRLIIDMKMKQETAKRLIRKYTDDILHIEIKNRNDTNELLPHVAKCSNLYGLKLISCQGQVRNIANLNNTVNVQLLRQVLEKCPFIQSLEVRQTAFRYGMRNFCPARVKFKKLRIKSETNLEVIEYQLQELTDLRDLRLQGVKLYDDRSLIHMCLNNEKTLTVLKLDVWKLPIDAGREDELMQFIGRCQQLTKLSLQNYSTHGLTDAGFVYLSNLKKLKSLTVTGARRVSARAIMRLFYEPHVHQFEKVNLGRCPELHQLVLKFIADRCPNLRKLYVDQFGLSCPCLGVVDLQYVAAKCPQLEHVELSSMGGAVGDTLPAILRSFPKLRSFKYFVRPLKDYFIEYDPVMRRVKQQLPLFHVSCSLKYGIVGYKK